MEVEIQSLWSWVLGAQLTLWHELPDRWQCGGSLVILAAFTPKSTIRIRLVMAGIWVPVCYRTMKPHFLIILSITSWAPNNACFHPTLSLLKLFCLPDRAKASEEGGQAGVPMVTHSAWHSWKGVNWSSKFRQLSAERTQAELRSTCQPSSPSPQGSTHLQ